MFGCAVTMGELSCMIDTGSIVTMALRMSETDSLRFRARTINICSENLLCNSEAGRTIIYTNATVINDACQAGKARNYTVIVAIQKPGPLSAKYTVKRLNSIHRA